MAFLNKMAASLLLLTTVGCGPHHVEQVTVTAIKYKCQNWFQTVALCETLDECNKVCKEAAGSK
jgi:hypothetical protein